MNYIFKALKNSSGLVEYLNDISVDYSLFLEGISLGDLDKPLIYSILKSSGIKKLKNIPVISSLGPELINTGLRTVIEKLASEDVEFYEPELFCGNTKIEGFTAINIKKKRKCLDLENSEFRLTNFDPHNPTYWFYYMVVNEDILDSHIVRCEEIPRFIIVSEKFKKECIDAGLKELVFCQTLDITPQNRSKEEII